MWARIDGTQPALEEEISGAVTTLRCKIEAWGLDYFTEKERIEIRRVAVQIVDLRPGDVPANTEIQNWQVSGRSLRPSQMTRAMQLVWALDEPELRDRVMAIGSDLEALCLRGIVDEKLPRNVERNFARLVEGEPPMPHYSLRRERLQFTVRWRVRLARSH